MSHHTTLAMTDNINIRLHSIEFSSNPPRATVTFKLFAHAEGNSGNEQLLCHLSQTTERWKRDGGANDYDRIVHEAGSKLVQDFNQVTKTLSHIAQISH